ncbi:Na+/H+ antiporter subunit G [Corynebacterium epidermidicanis]|uniref:Multisubunit sodium/proton antiporter, MrpG subunit n=1 Tax=Corynebacterium epidermidicanis TaxID=1050174 RepID=A0A0G3GLS9_9CORY|nr:Na+/H+ antiporter subunit G [Corynebacterium epidermidicanis]AKK02146.1 multisubunit sodium/proton antiporter, MrpG subunit [Corynebacterium epidermidicanis]
MLTTVSMILQIVAALFILGTVIALWRAPDALTRINVMGPTTGVALPLLAVAKLLEDFAAGPVDANSVVRVVLVICGLWIVAAVSSFYMARAIHDAVESL